jgi:6-phosphogluconolactonase
VSALRFAPDGSDAAVLAHLANSVARGGPVRLALAGGSTPAPILSNLTASAPDLSHVDIWPTDERCVALDHPASNVAALRRMFSVTGARVHALREGPAPGPFDLVWLGMGADGHIASLFAQPDIAVDAEAAVVRLTPAPLPPEAPFARLTLTYAALLNTAQVIIVARGAAKRALLEAAARGEGDLPIARLARHARAPILVFWQS